MNKSIEKQVTQILNNALKVITVPAQFFGQMPKTGGLVEPLIFMVVMGVVSGFLQALLGLVGFGVGVSLMMALASVILVPIFIVIFGFVGAGIMYLIWRALGSQESYETAYRCTAYAGAIAPITTLLAIIPYLGTVLGFVWMLYLMVIASTQVHQIEPKKAWTAFGIFFACLALINTCSQHSARQMEKQLERMDQMSPEETGEAMGKFLKGLQKGSGQE